MKFGTIHLQFCTIFFSAVVNRIRAVVVKIPESFAIRWWPGKLRN
jgi:hypothetical protein